MAPQKNIAIEPGLFTRVEEEAQKQGRTPDDIANEATRRFLASGGFRTFSSTAKTERASSA